MHKSGVGGTTEIFGGNGENGSLVRGGVGQPDLQLHYSTVIEKEYSIDSRVLLLASLGDLNDHNYISDAFSENSGK